MITFTLDPVIDLGDILTFAALIGAIFTIYFQARSVRISERKLNIEVLELGDIVRALEAESQARIKLQSKQRKQHIRQLHGDADLWEHSNSLYHSVSSTYSMTEEILRNRLEVILLSISAISVMLHTDHEQIDKGFLSVIAETNYALIDLLRIEKEAQYTREERTGKWQEEFESIINQIKNNDTTELRNMLAKKQEEQITINAELLVDLENAIKTPQQQYQEVREKFFSYIISAKK